MSLFHTKKKFFSAVAAGDADTVKAYIEHNRDWLTAVTDKKEKNTAMHIAAAAGQEALMTFLLAEGASAYNSAGNGDTPLHLAVRGSHVDIVKKLIADRRVSITGYFSSRRTPLQEAISANNPGILRLFLESGKADLTANDPPALYYAVDAAKPECVKLLLAAGADPNVPKKIVSRSYDDDYYGHYSSSSAKETITFASPLQRACTGNQAEIARMLLEAGAKLQPGEFPMHAAAVNGNLELAALLAARDGLFTGGKDAAGKTALHLAAEKNRLEMARFLLAKGIDRKTADNSGRTALSYAQQFALTEMIDVLQGSSLAPALKAAAAPALVAVSAPVPAPLPAPPETRPPAPACAPEEPKPAPGNSPGNSPGKSVDADAWTLDGASVVHIRNYTAQNRRLTEIFNFETRERVVISENLALKTETLGPHESFDTITEQALARALAEFRKLGGAAEEGDVLRNRLGKLKAGPG